MSIAPGVGPLGTVSYGNAFSAVVGASGSLTSRRSRKTFRPSVGPRSFSRLARKFESATSEPPPLPKIEPMNAKPAIASASVTVGSRWASGSVCS